MENSGHAQRLNFKTLPLSPKHEQGKMAVVILTTAIAVFSYHMTDAKAAPS
jgi:hypothetical protein